MHSFFTHVAKSLVPYISTKVGNHIRFILAQLGLHHIQCAMFLCSGHYEVPLTELPFAILKTTIVAFVVQSSDWYEIQIDIRDVLNIRQLHIAIVTSCVRWEPLSWRSYVEWCTIVNHLGVFFICKFCSWLLAMNKSSSSLVARTEVPFSSRKCVLVLRLSYWSWGLIVAKFELDIRDHFGSIYVLAI